MIAVHLMPDEVKASIRVMTSDLGAKGGVNRTQAFTASIGSALADLSKRECSVGATRRLRTVIEAGAPPRPVSVGTARDSSRNARPRRQLEVR